MEINNTQPVFVQIADLVADRILDGNLKADAQVPSVRELASTLQVNPNTVMRAFERLTAAGLTYNRRGLGYYVAPDAREKAMDMRRKRLVEEVLPAVAREMKLLGITTEEAMKHLV